MGSVTFKVMHADAYLVKRSGYYKLLHTACCKLVDALNVTVVDKLRSKDVCAEAIDRQS